MLLTERRFREILNELVDENPLACQAVLSILDIIFTKKVNTMAVTMEGRPCLLVNLDFLNENAITETDVKAVILHEFLHVLLNHTEQYTRMNPLTNIALDSVINAIIHRSLGAEYSGFFSRYYQHSKGIAVILRFRNKKDEATTINNYNSLTSDEKIIIKLWHEIYIGKVVVDDILDAAKSLEQLAFVSSTFEILGGKHLIGGHDHWKRKEISEELRKALDRALSEMNGDGIWRSPKDRGIGANPYEALFVKKDERMTRWERTAWRVLMNLLTPDRAAPQREWEERETVMPILTERDRRSFLKTLWSPLIPETVWQTNVPKKAATTQIYLDVSGSMNAEMQAIVALLNRMRRFIRMPFWAFSNEVKPAVIERGILKTQTTGGTSMNCVLRHLAETKPGKALIITDGYIESCEKLLLNKNKDQTLHILLSRDGSAAEIQKAGIPYTQLEKYLS